MAQYCYNRLSLPASIRLLRLLPSEKDVKGLQAELFDYQLISSNRPSHPYEAVSYSWGDVGDFQSISIGKLNLRITQNLYTALIHLRDHDCSRVLWVDAVCINQGDDEEKEHQVSLMAKIYAKAQRVIVWLGEAKEGGDRALEEIRIAGEKSMISSKAESIYAVSTQRTVWQLLERPWFRRVWILQEMAAAQHVQIICGSTEIDGHAFCLGLDFLGTAFEEVRAQVTFLIQGAVFRSGIVSQKHGRLSLNICSLGELLDMYHAHRATRRHDKVYALLGMCSDDLGVAGLEPNYSLPWKELMQRLVKFILGNDVSVDTWNEKEIAVIKSRGCVIGKVETTDINNVFGGRQKVAVIVKRSPGCGISGSARWILQISANGIKKGDLVCLLHGSLMPVIVRSSGDYFVIVVIAAVPPTHIRTVDGIVDWSTLVRSVSFIRNFLLVWNWETSVDDPQYSDQFHVWTRTNDLQLRHAEPRSKNSSNGMDNAIRNWDVAQILGDLYVIGEAEERRQRAIEFFRVAVGKEHTHTLECHCSQIPLSWAAESGDEALVDIILARNDVDPDLKDYFGRTPLLWAANNGHEIVVRLLLETGKAEVNSKDRDGLTPLWRAVQNGHKAVVKILLETGKAEADFQGRDGVTPLLLAAEGGHDTIVKLLLEKGKAEANLGHVHYGSTPLIQAAQNGHEAIVKRLLGTGKAEVNLRDKAGATPLLRAAQNGHNAVVKLLLETGQAEVDLKDRHSWTPLLLAAQNGHDAVVKLLLEKGKAEANLGHVHYGSTPLILAAQNGHEAAAKLLLSTGKAEVNSKDKAGVTPLLIAAQLGHKAIVKLLLETGKAEVNLGLVHYGATPLCQAAQNGHEAIVKLLLETGKADINLKDREGSTPLYRAAQYGHEAIVKLLLGRGNAEVNCTDRGGATPLLEAARNGHEAVVKLLLSTGKAEVNSKDEDGVTPLLVAAQNGHEATVKLLLETGNAEVSQGDDRYGRLPLGQAAQNGHKAVVKLLLETGKAEVNSKDKAGATPLLIAAQNGHNAVIKLLLETGQAEVDAKNRNGSTPLFVAAQNGHEAVVKLLLETGKAEVNSRDREGLSPLSLAAQNGHEAAVKLLLQTGKTEVNFEEVQNRMTPLLRAAQSGHKAVVKLLLETGKAEVDLKNVGGLTPLSLAAQNGHEAVVELLLELGKAEVNSRDRDGLTPLDWAIRNGHKAVMKHLESFSS